MTRKIIDMRSRPAFVHDFYGATPGTGEYEVAKWLNRRVGSKHDEHFTRSVNTEAFVAEIREAGITAAVVVGRDTPNLIVSNAQVLEIIAPHPELIGIASVDPQKPDALDELERAVKQFGLRGVNIEPGFGNPPLHADDPLLYPVYEACVGLNVPVFLMSGPTTPDLDYARPEAVGRVARAFPQLPIVCYHGFYPYVNEVIGVAFRYDNVYLVPDMYIFLPGGRLYVEAANGFLRDQLLFGSSYPFRAMAQTVGDFLNLGFQDDVLDGVLFNNAKRLLGLDI
ncbi:amidohydrolase family protein [Candidatus Methylobacter oryzae]|uniref:Amidohydrolase n=1 Tax=Candidatus Methylobacter oryzae TaxID=2497749 RepID=A0ABY3CAZ8_9GAMM|nr:amidohydrolase family protein [Candidatus Methylobacter oryzae]TRW95848.1 amidohydrolase [Candidatus Methylobacter oryzae]